mmetsp:Transcript_16339/g.35370  ORF Transcript_16339/g.35370 Transcript_16339/m.35370 type:complete len:113 (-) Transcript_16339:14-352(-)
MKGKYSNAILTEEDKENGIVVLTEEDKQAGMGKEATNSTSESGHALSTYSLTSCGTVNLNHVAGEGQCHSNNDYGHDHKALISERSKKTGPKKASLVESRRRVYGSVKTLPL